MRPAYCPCCTFPLAPHATLCRECGYDFPSTRSRYPDESWIQPETLLGCFLVFVVPFTFPWLLGLVLWWPGWGAGWLVSLVCLPIGMIFLLMSCIRGGVLNRIVSVLSLAGGVWLWILPFFR